MILPPLLALNGVELRSFLEQALPILMIFGYLLAASLTMTLAIRYGGGEDGKRTTISAIIISAAPAIMYVLYKILTLYVVTIPSPGPGDQLCPDRVVALKSPLPVFAVLGTRCGAAQEYRATTVLFAADRL